MTAQEIVDKIMERHEHVKRENFKRRTYRHRLIEEKPVWDEVWYWAKPDKQLARDAMSIFEKNDA